MVYKTVKDWYHAYVQCKRLGASLAILDTNDKITQMLKFTTHHKTLAYRDFFYIGLTKETWIPVRNNPGKS